MTGDPSAQGGGGGDRPDGPGGGGGGDPAARRSRGGFQVAGAQGPGARYGLARRVLDGAGELLLDLSGLGAAQVGARLALVVLPGVGFAETAVAGGQSSGLLLDLGAALGLFGPGPVHDPGAVVELLGGGAVGEDVAVLAHGGLGPVRVDVVRLAASVAGARGLGAGAVERAAHRPAGVGGQSGQAAQCGAADGAGGDALPPGHGAFEGEGAGHVQHGGEQPVQEEHAGGGSQAGGQDRPGGARGEGGGPHCGDGGGDHHDDGDQQSGAGGDEDGAHQLQAGALEQSPVVAGGQGAGDGGEQAHDHEGDDELGGELEHGQHQEDGAVDEGSGQVGEHDGSDGGAVLAVDGGGVVVDGGRAGGVGGHAVLVPVQGGAVQATATGPPVLAVFVCDRLVDGGLPVASGGRAAAARGDAGRPSQQALVLAVVAPGVLRLGRVRPRVLHVRVHAQPLTQVGEYFRVRGDRGVGLGVQEEAVHVVGVGVGRPELGGRPHRQHAGLPQGGDHLRQGRGLLLDRPELDRVVVGLVEVGHVPVGVADRGARDRPLGGGALLRPQPLVAGRAGGVDGGGGDRARDRVDHGVDLAHPPPGAAGAGPGVGGGGSAQDHHGQHPHDRAGFEGLLEDVGAALAFAQPHQGHSYGGHGQGRQ